MKKKSANKPSLIAVITNALDDLKAQNVVTMDVAQLTDVTDTLIIASGSSNRQVRALAQHAVDEAKKKGMPCMGIEGLDGGEWVLADFGDAVLHVMQPEVREFYDLEKLWQAPESKTELPIKSATPKTAAEKPSKTKAAAGKASAAPAAEYVTQSDAAKARKAPKKPKAPVAPGSKKTTSGKVAPSKAGVLAKTGTRKPTSSKPAAAKTAAQKPAAKKATAGQSATKKTAVRKPRSS